MAAVRYRRTITIWQSIKCLLEMWPIMLGAAGVNPKLQRIRLRKGQMILASRVRSRAEPASPSDLIGAHGSIEHGDDYNWVV